MGKYVFYLDNKSHQLISIKQYINFYGKHSHSDLNQMIQKHKCGRNSAMCSKNDNCGGDNNKSLPLLLYGLPFFAVNKN